MRRYLNDKETYKNETLFKWIRTTFPGDLVLDAISEFELPPAFPGLADPSGSSR